MSKAKEILQEELYLIKSNLAVGSRPSPHGIIKTLKAAIVEVEKIEKELKAGLKPFQDTLGKWANETFGKGVQTQEGITNHLVSEVIEFIESEEPEEAADCFMLLLQHAHECGYDLLEEAQKKHEINLKREWGKPDKNGVIEHIRG